MIKINGREINFESFPNGETRLITDNLVLPIGLIREMHFKYENDADLIKLMFAKNYLGKSDINLTLYYAPYSRMDRSENGSPFTLKYVSNFINGLGFNKVTIVEPHSDVTLALLDNSEPYYINFDLVEEVKEMVGFDEDKDFLMFPDAGASKRYSKMKAKNVVIGNKVRDFVSGEIKGLDLMGDTSKAQGRTAIIVDDLSSYGGTFVHSANRLREEGFTKVILLVAHAENSIFKGKLFEHVDKVFTTDSLLTEHTNWENQKFKEQLHVFDLKEWL